MVPVLDVWSRFLLDMEAEHYSPEKDIKKNKPLPNLLFLRGSMLSKNAMSVHRLTIDTWQIFQWNFLASPRLPKKILE